MNRQTLLWLCVFTLMLLSPSISAATDSYSVVLASSPGTGSQWSLKPSPMFDDRYAYITQTEVKGKTWERLNLGFFDSRKDASAQLGKIQKLYPGAWLRKASSSEVSQAKKTNIHAPVTVAARPASKPDQRQQMSAHTTGMSQENLEKIMQDAKEAFKKRDYSRAIRLFNAVVSAGDNQYSEEALELLGLSRQRNGQNAQAASIYERYLEKYKDSDNAIRVRQRLNALMTETLTRNKDVNMEAKNKDDTGEFSVYGSLSQYYSRNETSIDGAGSETTNSLLVSFADTEMVYRTDDFRHKLRVSVDNNYDFTEEDEPSQNRIYELYYEAGSTTSGSFIRLGRQKVRRSVLANRYDGLALGYQITPDYHITLLGGSPVEYDDKTKLNGHKLFYGFIFDTGTFFKYWDAKLFYFKQTVDDVDDSTNTGAEVYYRDGRNLLYSLIDYEMDYGELNTLYINASSQVLKKTQLHMNAYMRQTPSISTSNALIGQSEESIEDLLKTMNIEQVRQLARDRTTKTNVVTIGGTQDFSKKYQMNLDVTAASTDGTVASGGVPASPATGTDIFLSGQLVGNGIFAPDDVQILGLRHYQTDLSDTISFIYNSRYRFTRRWRLYPRLQYDHRKRNGGGARDAIRYYFKTDYLATRDARFDFEIGYEQASDDTSATSFDSNTLSLLLGYRLDF